VPVLDDFAICDLIAPQADDLDELAAPSSSPATG